MPNLGQRAVGAGIPPTLAMPAEPRKRSRRALSNAAAVGLDPARSDATSVFCSLEREIRTCECVRLVLFSKIQASKLLGAYQRLRMLVVQSNCGNKRSDSVRSP